MEKLPFWRPTKGMPASYDSESATVIEMVAKLYGTISSLIDEYNTEINKLNEEFQNYENDVNQSNECFKSKMIETMHDFIESMNMINDRHTQQINVAIENMTNNIDELAVEIINQGLQNGSIVVGMTYDETEEELTMTGTVVDGSGDGVTYNAMEESLNHE